MPAPTFLIAVLLLFLGFVPAASTQAHFVADSASAACSTVTSDTNAWQQVTTHHGVTLKLPPHFVEKHYAVTIGTVTSQEWRDGLGASVTIDVGGGPKELTKAGVIPHDKNFAYSECTDSINGLPVLIQSMRGSGVVFRPEGQWPTYDVYATFELGERSYLRVTADAPTLESQRQLLTVVRTIMRVRHR